MLIFLWFLVGILLGCVLMVSYLSINDSEWMQASLERMKNKIAEYEDLKKRCDQGRQMLDESLKKYEEAIIIGKKKFMKK